MTAVTHVVEGAGVTRPTHGALSHACALVSLGASNTWACGVTVRLTDLDGASSRFVLSATTFLLTVCPTF